MCPWNQPEHPRWPKEAGEDQGYTAHFPQGSAKANLVTGVSIDRFIFSLRHGRLNHYICKYLVSLISECYSSNNQSWWFLPQIQGRTAWRLGRHLSKYLLLSKCSVVGLDQGWPGQCLGSHNPAGFSSYWVRNRFNLEPISLVTAVVYLVVPGESCCLPGWWKTCFGVALAALGWPPLD